MIQRLSPTLRLLAVTLVAALTLTACSEEDDTIEEYPDWENTNTAYFVDLYTSATALIAQGNTTWKLLRAWSLPEDNEIYTAVMTNYIVVEVLEEGTGAGCPLYTDNVWVHYRGRLLPSVSYPEGYIFDQSYYGEFNEQTAMPAAFSVSALVDGFATALQNMHIGDYWRVYMPYELGYGTIATTSVPAYSTLIFEIKLVAYANPDVELPVTW